MNKEEITALIVETHSITLDLQKRLAALEDTAKKRGTRGECMGFAIDLGLGAAAGEAFYDRMEADCWTKNNGKAKIGNWKATMRVWKRNGWIKRSTAVAGGLVQI